MPIYCFSAHSRRILLRFRFGYIGCFFSSFTCQFSIS
uniref:Uncharacterized protein n=1 Tax=Solanum lycopersicum TaxID=4081 RepID=A0A3Q7JRK1_SOLLC